MGYYDDEDYDEDDYDDYEENVIMEAGTAMEESKMKIEFDTETMQKNIIKTVEENLKSVILNSIKNEVVNSIQDEIKSNVHEIIRGYVKDIFENEIIVSTDKWGDNKKEFTLKESVVDEIKNIFTNGLETKDSYDRYSRKVDLDKYFIDKCVTPQIKKELEGKINEVQKSINNNMKMIFDKATKDMLSDTVMNVLMANDTYQKIGTSVASIANKVVED